MPCFFHLVCLHILCHQVSCLSTIDAAAGKTQTAVMLARHFDAAILTLDGVVMDSIHNGNTEAGIRARQFCGEAARRNTEETKWTEVEGSEKKVAGLSVEALTAHTQLGNGQLVRHSIHVLCCIQQIVSCQFQDGHILNVSHLLKNMIMHRGVVLGLCPTDTRHTRLF